MNDYQVQLTTKLLEKNQQLSFELAMTWVELLWEDFESTYARAGYKYAGEEMTSRVVGQWIEHYGAKLHEFVALNPKYQHLLDQTGMLH